MHKIFVNFEFETSRDFKHMQEIFENLATFPAHKYYLG